MISVYDGNKYIIIVTPNDFTFLVGLLELEGIKEYVIYRTDKEINQPMITI